MDAAVRRSDLRCISIRPCWVHHEGNYERNLGPQVRDPSLLSPNFWSYIDVYDLADALVLAVQSYLPGHEVFYIASPDNVGGRPFVEMVRKYYGETIQIRPLAREDASGISAPRPCGCSAMPPSVPGGTTWTSRAGAASTLPFRPRPAPPPPGTPTAPGSRRGSGPDLRRRRRGPRGSASSRAGTTRS